MCLERFLIYDETFYNSYSSKNFGTPGQSSHIMCRVVTCLEHPISFAYQGMLWDLRYGLLRIYF